MIFVFTLLKQNNNYSIELNSKNYYVAFITKNLNDGGIERVTQLLTNQLSQRGAQILLITSKENDNDFKVPNNVLRFIIPFVEDEPQEYIDSLSWDQIQDLIAKQTMQLLKLKQNLNIKLFVCQEHWSIRNFLTIQTLKRNNIPVIAVDHNFFLQPLCSFQQYLFDFSKQAYPMADAVLCLSRVDVQLWRKLGVKNALYMPNPLTFDINAIQLSTLSSKNIVLIGRFNKRHKQQHLAIQMMQHVLKSEPDAILQLIGSGSDEYRNECKQLAQQLNIQNSVQFIDFQSDIERFYKNASVLILTSAIEGFPMVLAEAKSFGIPAVAFDLEFCELYQEGVSVVGKSDVEGMAKEVIQLLQNQTLRIEKGKEARQSVEKFNTDATIDKWVRLITGIIDGTDIVAQMQEEEDSVSEEKAMEIYKKELAFWGQEDFKIFD
ncbi:Glycosyl_transferases group [Hexamita inflata]|uniref:Glycosyl transferases group n=1 Tax=Hexamita inflata TaxID=28002 RepID=A0AA86TG12_9EUKA|nr:Glycosyl transferases group [Hexamita inflata]